MKYYSLYFGQTYGSGNYGEGTYACAAGQEAHDGVCTAATSGSSNSGGNSSSGSGGSLTNTGIAVVAIVTLACLILFVSVIVRVWRRKPALQPVEIPSEEAQSEDQQS